MTTLTYPHPQPIAPGTALTVAPGIVWVRMPLPFQLNHINLWLLEDGAGWVVIDTGVGLDDTRALWERIFAGELGDRPLTRAIVTHFHPDHMGNAGWLTRRWGIELWCAQGEYLFAHLAHRASTPEDFAPRLEHYRRNGCDEEALARLAHRGNHYPGLVPTVPHEHRRLRDGDVLTIGGRRWQVLVVLGHAPEHACLWSQEDGVLISGDQVLPKITTNVSVWAEQPRENPLGLYLDSLARFRSMAPGTLVLPSHGLPFRGLHQRIAMLRDHHAARLGEALDALTEPRSAAELLPMLFRRTLDTHQLQFAMGEALAHLNFLEADGRALRTLGTDGIHRFRKA
jgi:glyoxylase-like metal-dependent hydrolase (beta-lactamase superfamily II)